MKSWLRWTILAAVISAALLIVIFKGGGEEEIPIVESASLDAPPDSVVDDIPCCTDEEWAEATGETPPGESRTLPRLLELGSVGCKACQMMAPIIEELKEEYAGRLSVEFYDVREDPAPARRYGIRIIPTQIFIDGAGNEIFRHEGYFPKEEILPILAKMGVTE